jgi:hypothetical protein
MFTQSISAKPQQWPKNRRLLLLLTNFGKKTLPLHRFIASKSFFLFLCFVYLPLTLAKIFVFASFFPKVSKVKERG